MYKSREYIASFYPEGKATLIYKDEERKQSFYILSQEEFAKLKAKKEITAYVKRINEPASGKEYGTLYLYQGSKEFAIDVYGRKPKGYKNYGYLKVDNGKYVEVVRKDYLYLYLLVLMIIVVGLILLYLGLHNINQQESTTNEVVELNEDNTIKKEQKMGVYITLPDGELSYDQGFIKEKDDLAYQVIWLNKDNENIILEGYLKDGSLNANKIDFEKIDFELIPGIHDGKIVITLADGSLKEYPINLIIREKSGGTVGVGYQDEVIVDLNNKIINLNYKQGPSTNATMVEVILLKDDKEYCLAKSDEIKANEELKSLKLENTLINKGTYQGYLRINFLNEDQSLTNIQSDIEVDIEVN